MHFENSFDVDAPLEQVWDAVLDVARVAPTVPGAQVLERTGDDAYKVAIKVKVGPMSMTYRGEVEITERDENAHRAVMKARAKESRGQGTADADVTMQLSGADGRTSATVTTDVALSGKVATMGQGVLQDVSGRLIDTFAKNLAAMLAGGGDAGAAAAAGGTAAAAAPTGEAAAAAPTGAAAPAGGEATATGDAAPTGEAAAPATGAAATDSPDAAGNGAAREPAPAADALDLGSLGGQIIAERLQDPRRLGGLLALVALVAFLLGRRSAAG